MRRSSAIIYNKSDICRDPQSGKPENTRHLHLRKQTAAYQNGREHQHNVKIRQLAAQLREDRQTALDQIFHDRVQAEQQHIGRRDQLARCQQQSQYRGDEVLQPSRFYVRAAQQRYRRGRTCYQAGRRSDLRHHTAEIQPRRGRRCQKSAAGDLARAHISSRLLRSTCSGSSCR